MGLKHGTNGREISDMQIMESAEEARETIPGPEVYCVESTA